MRRRRHDGLRPEALRELERWYRVRGYDDGYAGKPAGSFNPYYSEGWRRGRDARQQEGDT